VIIVDIIIAVVALGAIAILMGVFLAYAAKKFEVKKDPKINEILDILPGVNCGACGYPGCSGYAEAVALQGVDINLCAPGGAEVVEKISAITGQAAEDKEKMVARVMCQGDNTKVTKRYEFDADIKTCANALLYYGGDKSCMYGCLGYGDCEKVCPTNAIKVNEKGIAVVDEELCISCEKCVIECPKNIIKMVREKSRVSVLCSSHEKGAASRKVCSISCIACGICAKNCPVDAIEVKGNLAVIDDSKCINCGICEVKCPTNAIKSDIKEVKKAKIVEEKCIGCTACARVCPVDAIEGEVKKKHKVIAEKCIGCGLCYEKCKFDAIKLETQIKSS
jgi:electron transport complex protein RnfB